MRSGTDAGGDLDVDHLVLAAGGAVPVLGQGAEVGVVVDVDRSPKRSAATRGVDPHPAGEDGRGPHDVVADRRRQAHADRGRSGPGLDQPREDRGREVEALLVAMVGGDGPLLDQWLPGEVGDRDREVAVADVDADHEAGGAGEPDRPCPGVRCPARSRSGRRRELADDVGDGAGARPVTRASSAWVTGSSARAAEYVDHAALVGGAQRRRRAGRARPCCPSPSWRHCAASHPLSSRVDDKECRSPFGIFCLQLLTD